LVESGDNGKIMVARNCDKKGMEMVETNVNMYIYTVYIMFSIMGKDFTLQMLKKDLHTSKGS